MIVLTSERLRAALAVIDHSKPTSVSRVASVCHWAQDDALRALSMLAVQGYVRPVTHISSDSRGLPTYTRLDKPEAELIGAEHAK
jgi:hypothetical protein